MNTPQINTMNRDQRYFVMCGQWPARPLHTWVTAESHREILEKANVTNTTDELWFTFRGLTQLNEDMVS